LPVGAPGASSGAPVPSREATTIAGATPVGPWRLVFGAAWIVLGVVGTLYFAYQVRAALTLALIALLLAVGLQGPVARLHKLGVPRPIGLLFMYLAAIAGLVLAIWLLFPPVVRDLREFVAQAPTYLADIQRYADRLGFGANLPQLADLEGLIVSEVSSDWQGYLSRVVSILSFTVGLFGGLLNAFLVLVLSIFIVVEGPRFRDHLLSLLPDAQQPKWAAITQKIALKIQGWMLGTLFLAIVIGTVTTVALLLLGMPYPFLFGFIAAIGECIPMIGPIIAAVPAVGISAFYGWGMFAAVLVLYIAIQQLENYILVPRIMGSQVDLPGLVVIVAFLLGSELAGITGGILAMPVAAIFQVLWLDWAVPAIRVARESRRGATTTLRATTTTTTAG
jgi:predicted PurR-regulated permease PerM